ncbi:MAG: hypothetical protein ACRDB0_01365 [Paraclostridium sp.]
MSRFRLEWQHSNGKVGWTYANTEEMALVKAQPFVEDIKIVSVRVYEVVNKKVLKSPMEYMLDKGLITEEECTDATK